MCDPETPSTPPGPDDYELLPTPPTNAEYRRLRLESGLTPMGEEQAAGALANSWSFCHVRSAAGEAVAMGRIIGDGGWYFVVADIATLPAFQRQGLARRVMRHLLDDIADRAPSQAYVTLTADAPGRRLYESLGFADVRETDQTGMSLVLG